MTMSWLPSYPYPEPKKGYWEPITSTLNWCEEDYYATPYAAEIVNTLTNLAFIYLGVKGIRSCQKYGHDSVFLVAYLGYALVGVGSFLFHATLKYPMQLIDELSMIYTTCLMAYACFSFNRSRDLRIALGVGLFALSMGITAYYHYLQDPFFHQTTYAVLTAIVLLRSVYLMETGLRPSRKETDRHADHLRKTGSEAKRELAEAEDRRDAAILKEMWVMVGLGMGVFLGGFGIWQLDNIYCSNLRRWRREIGLPWGVLLEGHGWWHLMTGVGAYFCLVWGIWLRHCLNRRQDEFVCVWPRLLSLPEIVRVDRTVGYMNGNGLAINGNGYLKDKKSL